MTLDLIRTAYIGEEPLHLLLLALHLLHQQSSFTTCTKIVDLPLYCTRPDVRTTLKTTSPALRVHASRSLHLFLGVFVAQYAGDGYIGGCLALSALPFHAQYSFRSSEDLMNRNLLHE